MKILHILTNTELGGAQRVCIDLCASAIRDGYSVAVTSMTGGYLWDQLPKDVIQFPLKNMIKPIKLSKDIAVYFELKKVVKTFKPDIIHLHNCKAGVLGRIVALWKPNSVVYSVHGFDTIRIKHRIFLPLERILQHFCGAIVGVSEYDSKNLISEKINQNVQTIYNGIDENTIIPALIFPVSIKEKKVILSIARIAPPKKTKMFLDIAKKLPDYAFVLIGGDPEHSIDELKRLFNIPENVYMLGALPDASNYIKLCDLFVLFSDHEGLPMTIIEAMCQKKAIVASDVGGIYELVDGENGALIKNDVDSATLAIKKILEDEALRKKMELRSYEKFLANFTLEKMWSAYKNLYEELIKRQRG